MKLENTLHVSKKPAKIALTMTVILSLLIGFFTEEGRNGHGLTLKGDSLTENDNTVVAVASDLGISLQDGQLILNASNISTELVNFLEKIDLLKDGTYQILFKDHHQEKYLQITITHESSLNYFKIKITYPDNTKEDLTITDSNTLNTTLQHIITKYVQNYYKLQNFSAMGNVVMNKRKVDLLYLNGLIPQDLYDFNAFDYSLIASFELQENNPKYGSFLDTNYSNPAFDFYIKDKNGVNKYYAQFDNRFNSKGIFPISIEITTALLSPDN